MSVSSPARRRRRHCAEPAPGHDGGAGDPEVPGLHLKRQKTTGGWLFFTKGADGDGYDGAKHKYVMRFAKGQRPPAEAFWSLTMYDSDFFFVANPIHRYDLAQRDSRSWTAAGLRRR